MAIPSLDSVVAGYINLPLRIQYAKWLAGLTEEDFSEYATYPERYLLAKIAVGVGAPKDEAAYISLPSEYVYKAIYDALTETEDGEADWDEKEALGRIAAAYNQSETNAECVAWFISLPKKYQLALIGALANGDIEPNGNTNNFPLSDIVAFWKLDDFSDASGNGYTLTDVGGVPFVAGKFGQAAEFSSGKYFTSTATIGVEWTISAWIKTTNIDTMNAMISASLVDPENQSVYNYYFMTFEGAITLGAGGVETPREALVADGQWHHVVATLGGGQLTAYLDGAEYASAIPLGDMGGASVSLGARNDGGNSFNGTIDSVGVWSRALTEPEIAQLYNGGNGLEPV